MASEKNSLQLTVTNRQILKIALPISLAILVPQLNFITNNIFLGHYSTEALAVASITGVYYLIFAGIGYGLNNGLQALISRRAGEGRIHEIGKLFNQGVYIAMGIAAIGILLTYFAAPAILKYALSSPEKYEQSISFLKIRIWGLPFLYIFQMRNALLVGTNQARYLVIGSIAETGTNIILDYLFIFGKMGLPAFGFNGAAIASVIAEFTGMLVIYLVIRLKGISKRFSLFATFRLDKKVMKLILSMSSPLIFQHAISIISWEFFFILIERNQSTQYDLAVSNTMRNIFGFFGVFIWAFAATANTMVSNVMGQQRQAEVIKLVHKIIKLSLIGSISAAILLNLFPSVLLSIYGQPQGFIDAAIPVVRVISIAMIFMTFATVWLNAVTGTGNSRITLLIEVVAIILYCIYVYFIMEKWKMPVSYGWMSEWIYWLSLFSLSFFYMRTGKWKLKVI